MATTQDYINQLKIDKQNLVSMLNGMGVEASANETFTSLTPKVGKIVTDPILQDKSITITENGTTNIVADEGYDGLYNVEVTTTVGSASPDYITDGLVTWFEGEDDLDSRGYWVSRVGTDYIYPKYQFTGSSTTNPIPHGQNSYINNKAYNLVTKGNYLKSKYTIEVVGKLTQPQWLITMNMAGSFGIGINETNNRVIFRNSANYMTNDWTGYLNKRFGATLYLDTVTDRLDTQSSTRDISNSKIIVCGSANGEPLKEIVNTTENLHYKEPCMPILHYYAATNTVDNRASGEVCCIRIYNRKLTNEEIAYNHEIDKKRFKLEK